MGGYLSHFVPAQRPNMTAQVNVVEDAHKEFLHFMLEHICLCVVKEYLDGDGPGGELKSLPLLRALLLYTRQDDLEGKPQLKKLLRVAVMVCHVYLATQKSSSDEFRKKHLDALVVCMDSKLDASRPDLPQSVVAKAKCCAVTLTLAIHGYEKAWELAEEYCKDQSMAQCRRKLMQTLRSLKKGDTSVEGVLEAFSMANFLEEFDLTVEELYTEFAPSVVEKVCEQLGMEKVLLSDPLAMLSRPDMAAPTHTWEGFEAAVERMARGRDAEGEGEVSNVKDEEDSCGEEKEEEWEEEEGEDMKATSSRKSDQRTNSKRRKYLLRRPKAPVSYVDEDVKEVEDVSPKGGKLHGELRIPEESGATKPLSAAGSDKEGRQTRQSPRKPEAPRRKVESEEEDKEEESRQEGMKPAAKSMSQQQKRRNRPKGHPHLESSGREDPSPVARRTPRKRGRKPTVTELQGEGQTEKTIKKKELKLAGRVLDPHVMSSSEDNNESDVTNTASPQKHLIQRTATATAEEEDVAVRGRSMEAASVLSRKRRHRHASNKASGDLATLVVEVDSLDSQSPDKKRKTTPEVKTGVTRVRPKRGSSKGGGGTSTGASGEESGSEYSKMHKPPKRPGSLRDMEDRDSPGPSGVGASTQSRSTQLSSDDDFDFFARDVESPNLKSPSCFQPKASLLNKNGSRKRVRWSYAEVSWLKRGVRLFGVGRWADIKLHFPFTSHRTPSDLKDKWRNLSQEEKDEVLRCS